MELTLKIDTRSKRGKILLQYILQLTEADDCVSVTTAKESKLLNEIEQGLKEVKDHQSGKKELKTIDQLLDEL